jgi:hypothetical protein
LSRPDSGKKFTSFVLFLLLYLLSLRRADVRFLPPFCPPPSSLLTDRPQRPNLPKLLPHLPPSRRRRVQPLEHGLGWRVRDRCGSGDGSCAFFFPRSPRLRNRTLIKSATTAHPSTARLRLAGARLGECHAEASDQAVCGALGGPLLVSSLRAKSDESPTFMSSTAPHLLRRRPLQKILQDAPARHHRSTAVPVRSSPLSPPLFSRSPLPSFPLRRVVVKKQELSYGIEAVFRDHVPALLHGNDGLIFTSAEAPYTPGTDPKMCVRPHPSSLPPSLTPFDSQSQMEASLGKLDRLSPSTQVPSSSRQRPRVRLHCEAGVYAVDEPWA